MRRFIQKTLAVVVLAVGLTMLVWGWHAFATVEPAPPLGDDEGIRMCPPTIGEMLGASPVGRKLGCLVVAIIGMAATGGSVLMLIQKEGQT